MPFGTLGAFIRAKCDLTWILVDADPVGVTGIRKDEVGRDPRVIPGSSPFSPFGIFYSLSDGP